VSAFLNFYNKSDSDLETEYFTYFRKLIILELPIILFLDTSLKNYANTLLNSYKNIKIISENVKDCNKKENNKIWADTEITGSNHPCRIEHICNARNKLLEEINKSEYDEYTYVIVIDLDSNGWDIAGILDSFKRKSEWDAIFGNSPNYYDYYALRMNSFPFGPEITGDSFWNLPNYTFNRNDLISVYSAFNGIGIYKKHIFTKYKYDFIVNDDIKTFYRNYISNNYISDDIMNIITKKCNKFPYGYKDEMDTIFWKSNSGYDNTVVCEHVSLNVALFNDGYKLFINPKMLYFR
jgi:hypothetical protein